LRRLLTSLTEEYQMSFDEANQKARPLENLAVSEGQVKDLERAIRALGPVNLDAVEQFDEVKNRLDFLNTQRDDVLSAKNLLLTTIEEMNDEVKERFKSTFEAIRESFKMTFKQMFGGGSADLILTEGDLLTAGVEISDPVPQSHEWWGKGLVSSRFALLHYSSKNHSFCYFGRSGSSLG